MPRCNVKTMARHGIAVICLLALASAWLAACHRTPDEQQVREAIAAAAHAAESADAGAFGDVLAEDFDGNQGEFDARRLVNLLRVAHLRDERITVVLGPIRIEPRGERLVASFTATLGGGGKLLPEHLGVYDVETAWRRDGSRWRCYNATWRRKL
jgi:hypothetical protein